MTKRSSSNAQPPANSDNPKTLCDDVTNFAYDVYDSEVFRSRAHCLVDFLADYLKACGSDSTHSINHETDNESNNWSRVHNVSEVPRKQSESLSESCHEDQTYTHDPSQMFKNVLPTISPENAFAYWENLFSTNNTQKSPSSSSNGKHHDPLLALLIDHVFPHVTKIHHGRNMGHQVGVPAPTAILATWFGDFLNNGTSIYEQGAAVVCLERLCCQWMAAKIGWGRTTCSSGPNSQQTLHHLAEGVFTSGGSLGNLTALLCARENYRDSVKRKMASPNSGSHSNRCGIDGESEPISAWHHGYFYEYAEEEISQIKEGSSLHLASSLTCEPERLAFLVSSECHYSVTRSIRIMGMGSAGLVPVPINPETMKMDVDQMQRIYTELHAKRQRELAELNQWWRLWYESKDSPSAHCSPPPCVSTPRVIGVVACAPSTSTGTFEDLIGIGKFCEQHGLWMHVDAAHGGGAYCCLSKGGSCSAELNTLIRWWWIFTK